MLTRFPQVFVSALFFSLFFCGAASPLNPDGADLGFGGIQTKVRDMDRSISGDGRYVAYESYASNLVPGDTNGSWDVFVHDRQSGVTERVSVHSTGRQGDSDSDAPSISSDGRFVAFHSIATNLVDDDTNRVDDVFVHDRQTGVTERASVHSNGTEGDRRSSTSSISGDGRFIAFASRATNLVRGDTNERWDVFVHDRMTRVTEAVSVGAEVEQKRTSSGSPSISADGRWVAYASRTISQIPENSIGKWQVLLFDRQIGQSRVVSLNSSGEPGNASSLSPAISENGRFVAFESEATDLVQGDTNGLTDVFVQDLQTGEVERVSVASNGRQTDRWSLAPALSADGRFIVFESRATQLVAGDSNAAADIFVHDRQSGVLTRVSVNADGAEGTAPSKGCSISGDGRFIAFQSGASSLVLGDRNKAWDVFVHDRRAATIQRVSVSTKGEEGKAPSRSSPNPGDARLTGGIPESVFLHVVTLISVGAIMLFTKDENSQPVIEMEAQAPPPLFDDDEEDKQPVDKVIPRTVSVAWSKLTAAD